MINIDNDHIDILDMNKQRLMSQNYWGVKPRNIEQAMALFLLDYDNTDITILTGPAGSGKTLLALAYGLHAVIEENRCPRFHSHANRSSSSCVRA